MDVHLLVYDLSRGLARQMSAQLLGFQIDAVYHTSIQVHGREYVYDGNIVAIVPGSSHLGRPEQEILLGRTELPMDVMEEYLDSLREMYTVDNYDLWKHNCNHFSNDLATFLVGKGIPEHILSLPDTVLHSPLGRMLMPMLNQQIDQNRRGRGAILGIQDSAPCRSVPIKPAETRGRVQKVSSLQQLDAALAASRTSCAVLFFTSPTCPPCQSLYALYDELAAEVGTQGALLLLDTTQAFDWASRYSVSVTPTFITLLHGEQENRWVGADAGTLRSNVKLLVQMAWPSHPHEQLRLPTFASPATAAPVLATKVPSLDKLLGKLPAADVASAAVQGVRHFVEARVSEGPAAASLPDVGGFAGYMRGALGRLPPEQLFAAVDLFRCGLADARFGSALLADEAGPATVAAVLDHVGGLGAGAPYALRLVTLHMACNLLSSPRGPEHVLGSEVLRTRLSPLVAPSFLDTMHSTLRVAAAALLYNVALANGAMRREGKGLLEGEQVELAAAVLEAIAQEEESTEALEGMLRGLGWLVYKLPLDGELAELLRTMDAAETILAKAKTFPDMGLIREVGQELVGKGLEKR